MIIWDEINKEHFIRIKGKEKVRIKATDFQIVGTNEDIEAAVKMAVDTKVSDEGYHAYLHIFSKSPLRYVIWLGPLHLEPIGPPWS